MKTTTKHLLLIRLVLPVVCTVVASAQEIQDTSRTTVVTSEQRTLKTVTISEPVRVKVEDLFIQAHLVAIVRILSGDTEHYPVAVYKAEVLTPFKGIPVGERIFFGPYITLGLGSEYLVFLRRAEKEISPKNQSGSPGLDYGPLRGFYEIMYQGYSVIPVKYVCAFDGKEIPQQCDYGVKVNTSQVILPNRIKTSPRRSDRAEGSDDRWVRKEEFVSFLAEIKRQE